MPAKTKFLSLLIVFLLFLPILINPRQPGRVLGIKEDRLGSAITDQNSEGEIAGGVIDNKLTNSESSENSEIKGRAVLNLDAETSVSSSKFNLAEEIVVSVNNKRVDLIISQIDKSLPEDVVLSLDKETFRQLGGDPQTQTELEVSITQAN